MQEEENLLRKRMVLAGLLLGLVMLSGTFGYWGLSQAYLPKPKHWSLGDCAYMTVITVSTVGYGEVFDLKSVPGGRLVTCLLIFSGLGVAVYFASTLTTFFVEGEFQEIRKRRKMEQLIAKVHDHIIVCGIGTSGIHAVQELLTTGWPVVCIDASQDRVARVHDLPKGANIPCIMGDATEDEVLLKAGITRARGLISALSADKDNLFVVISARELARKENPGLKIVAKAVDIHSNEKLRRGGADVVVTPAFIGGMRMVSEMVRPHVTEFLDLMLRDKEKQLRVDEVNLPPDSEFVGKTLAEARIREISDLLVVAVRAAGAGSFIYNPSPQLQLLPGMSLIVLGEAKDVGRLRQVTGHAFKPGGDTTASAAG